jgi:hypothetical protein
MAIKHTEFMKLTQGDKSVIEYLHAFINLSRYALEFVNTEVKKIVSFKRGFDEDITPSDAPDVPPPAVPPSIMQGDPMTRARR